MLGIRNQAKNPGGPTTLWWNAKLKGRVKPIPGNKPVTGPVDKSNHTGWHTVARPMRRNLVIGKFLPNNIPSIQLKSSRMMDDEHKSSN